MHSFTQQDLNYIFYLGAFIATQGFATAFVAQRS